MRIRDFLDWGDERKARRWALGLIPAWATVLLMAGLTSDGPILGDEFYHFTLARVIYEHGRPVWTYEGTTAAGDTYSFRFNQPYLWSEMLSWVFRLAGRVSVPAAQVYHTLWAALLAVSVLLLARTLDGRGTAESGVWSLLVLFSVPMVTLFSLAFYVDVPGSALGVLTVVLILRRRYALAAAAAALALLTKLFALFLLPAYAVVVAVQERRKPLTAARHLAVMGLIVGALHVPTIIQRQDSPHSFLVLGGVREVLRDPLQILLRKTPAGIPIGRVTDAAGKTQKLVTTSRLSHPGDLWTPSNWPRYFGVLLLPALAVALATGKARRNDWPVGLTAGFYALCFVAVFWRTPDARYTLSLCALLSPVAARALTGRGVLVRAAALAAALGTSAATAAVAHGLRTVSPEKREVMAFLAQVVPPSRQVFMYPEGDRLLWPRTACWYLRDTDTERLLTSSQGDTAARILAAYNLRFVVVKRRLVFYRPHAPASGYPPQFVRLLETSPDFARRFENADYAVFERLGPDTATPPSGPPPSRGASGAE